jgi:ABC-type multidrug transport system fused ATPase/permease subunit
MNTWLNLTNRAGKSTLVNLLCRLYDSTKGKLLINGHNVEEYDPSELRKHIAVLFQEKCRPPFPINLTRTAFLNGFSIRENVGIGQVDRLQDDKALLTALSTSGLKNFIQTLPNHLDTKLGRPLEDELSRTHNSLGLSPHPDAEYISPSGGQMQRLALARAFMRISSADLLILDEPSSNLDPEAEYELFRNIREVRRGKTTIFITHRFNTVRIADRILVLEEGMVKEFGAHEELMKIPGGRYRYLYSLQKKGYQDIRCGV